MKSSEEEIKMTYSEYKREVINCLTKGKDWEDGVWKYKGEFIDEPHILPLKDKKNTAKNRASAIKEHLDLDCSKCLRNSLSGLHQYAHHLNSSQLLCMSFFSELIDEECRATQTMVDFMRDAFQIDICEGAQCEFEYKEKDVDDYKFYINSQGELVKGHGYEGTSFDFHIKDDTTGKEIYFEIKFTEQGFKKYLEKDLKKEDDDRHIKKAEQYISIWPPYLNTNYLSCPSTDNFLGQYQIYRNVLRVRDSKKYVIFITDAHNPETKKDVDAMEDVLSGKIHNIQFTTWQKLIKLMENKIHLPYHLEALKLYDIQ